MNLNQSTLISKICLFLVVIGVLFRGARYVKTVWRYFSISFSSSKDKHKVDDGVHPISQAIKGFNDSQQKNIRVDVPSANTGFKKTEIFRSKIKLTFMALGSLVFIGVGVFLLLSNQMSKQVTIQSVLENKNMLVGIMCVCLFTLGFIFCLYQLLNSTPGLIIDENGVLDRTSMTSVGFIPWGDIAEVKEFVFRARRGNFREHFVELILKDPSKYAGMGNFFQRLLKYTSAKIYRDSIFISARGIKVKQPKLYELLTAYFKNFKNSSNLGEK